MGKSMSQREQLGLTTKGGKKPAPKKKPAKK